MRESDLLEREAKKTLQWVLAGPHREGGLYCAAVHLYTIGKSTLAYTTLQYSLSENRRSGGVGLATTDPEDPLNDEALQALSSWGDTIPKALKTASKEYDQLRIASPWRLLGDSQEATAFRKILRSQFLSKILLEGVLQECSVGTDRSKYIVYPEAKLIRDAFYKRDVTTEACLHYLATGEFKSVFPDSKNER